MANLFTTFIGLGIGAGEPEPVGPDGERFRVRLGGMKHVEGGQGSGGPRAKVSVGVVEALIQSLPGVEGARIVLDDWGAVREVHVLADSSRPPKSVVRDIESALQARWGLVVDHRRISVAQLGGVPRRPKWIRLSLQHFTVASDPVRGRTEVAVSLAPEAPRDLFGRVLFDPEIPTAIWQGRAAGASGGGLGVRLAAEATLQALNQSLLPEHSFSVGEIARVPMGDREVIVCLLHYHAPRGMSETLTGSALIRGEPMEASVRAVLNGSNRIYGLAMRRQSAPAGAQPDWAREMVGGGEAAAARERKNDAEAREPVPGGDGRG